MTVPLFDSVPGFDQPIAVLKHCHDKIRKQLATLQNLLAYLPQQGNTIAAQQAAKAVLQYFNKAAHLHHDDEEQDLMPMLQATASGADAALLATLVPEILADHQRMDQAWSTLRPQLDAIATGASTELSVDGVNAYVDAYHAHMSKEEGQLAPMAKRLFSARQMEQLGTAMQRRRGIAPEAAPAADPAAALAAMRTDYLHSSLSEADVLADPIAQFQKWFDEALKAQVGEPNAMTLSTVGPEGKPSSRIVLIKQFDQHGFTWYTNYNSEKGQQLQDNPNAALLFFWRELERQVRIEGTVVKTSAAESDEYFNVRPLQSRLAAIASQQSAPIASRAALEANFDAVAAAAGEAPPRPEHWGGYRLQPERIEFWQGRRSRFHDRIVFVRGADGAWRMERLQP
ncbi:pyridoxamine 5'-phosphate oxidase [Janthinobacterium psychrotolerans]|uniref:Pyridoxine/pyridoxamine 5'-phosphate oxidase n=1 Tax=Janthinobacterium psychrotolerans TaxID=1747903 RepID=A0A1A7C3X6_9BURK|nr:pyridoxamine 5'-phosphate oxidase [Janthinobacterium psychrotolerans]OBV40417.1 pyridoxamine 5'-phosphate oxidase [Janthinobacterium psychrotolerans]